MLTEDLALLQHPLLPGKDIRFHGELDDAGHLRKGMLSAGDHVVGYVESGIASLVAPHLNWPEEQLAGLRRHRSIPRAWEETWAAPEPANETLVATQPAAAAALERLAETEGLVLEIGAGPGGGLTPALLQRQPDRAVLMNELSIGILRLWKDHLAAVGAGRNVMFVAYDACTDAMRPGSVAAVSDWMGTSNTPDECAALSAAWGALTPGGLMVSVSLRRNAEDIARLPESFRKRWASGLRTTWRPAFEEAGFVIQTCEVFGERVQPPEDSGFSQAAHDLGYEVRMAFEYIVAMKPRA